MKGISTLLSGEMKDSAEMEIPRAYVADNIFPPLQRHAIVFTPSHEVDWKFSEAGLLLPVFSRREEALFGVRKEANQLQISTRLMLSR